MAQFKAGDRVRHRLTRRVMRVLDMGTDGSSGKMRSMALCAWSERGPFGKHGEERDVVAAQKFWIAELEPWSLTARIRKALSKVFFTAVVR